MKNSNFIKSITLVSFFSFIIAFILFKSGKYDTYIIDHEMTIQSSHNGGSLSDYQVKLNLLNYIENKRIAMSSSSKSGIIIGEEWINGNRNSIGRKANNTIQLFYAKYFEDNDSLKLKYENSKLINDLYIKSESELKQYLLQKIDSLNKIEEKKHREYMMSGSKSATIVDPKLIKELNIKKLDLVQQIDSLKKKNKKRGDDFRMMSGSKSATVFDFKIIKDSSPFVIDTHEKLK